MNAIVDLSLGRAKFISLGIGIVGLALSAAGWVAAPHQFFVAYLFAEIFFLGLSLGSLGILMIHHLTGGYWGYALRRLLEAAVGNLPLLALVFLPIFFGLAELYPWRHPEIIAANESLAKKQAYLNPAGFSIRTILAFAAWIVISHLLLKWSAEQDATSSVEPTRKMRTLSGPALVLYPVTMTFAAADWIMSTEIEWSSTMFPILICIGQILGALSLMILLFAWAARRSELSELAGENNFHKIGNLLLAFVMLWAYLAFSQFLIVWAGNLPREISWYLHRIAGSWRWVAGFVALFQFFLPFFLLLMAPLKKKRNRLALVAGCVLLSNIVTNWWTIAPTFYPGGFHLDWIVCAAFFGMGGLWFFAFLRHLAARRLIPLNDPRFALALPA